MRSKDLKTLKVLFGRGSVGIDYSCMETQENPGNHFVRSVFVIRHDITSLFTFIFLWCMLDVVYVMITVW